MEAVPLSGVYLMMWPKIGPFWSEYESSSHVRVTDMLSTDTMAKSVGAATGPSCHKNVTQKRMHGIIAWDMHAH